mmetsp:Transcript_105410/g.183338  ORF Transcript_105410/g.183338 Transcript_105410/m.183338 type:complete len:252 (-) Transcript_105410:73-828(-)
MIKAGRRGVLMTATATQKKRGAWRIEEEVDVEGSDQGGGNERKASQLEWEDLEREVQEERKRLRAAEDLASGRRGDVVGYDDVAGVEDSDQSPDGDDDDGGAESDDDEPDAATKQVHAQATEDQGPALPPEGVTTAGTAGTEARTKKRGGQKKKNKKKAAGGEQDGEPPKKKKKEEEDPNRWLKMKLQGESKPKRIDATRVVHYHDFDGGGAAGAISSPRPPALQASSSTAPGDFRSTLRMDLFDDDDDDE